MAILNLAPMILVLLGACKGNRCEDSGCLSLPPPVVAVSRSQSCATTSDGEILCWGAEAEDEGPPSEPVTQLVGDYAQICAAGLEEVFCWGSVYQPNYPAARVDVSALDVGVAAACLLDGSGFPACWVGDTGADWLLEEPSIPLKALAVATQEVACGLPSDGSSVLCWGNPNHAILRIAPDQSFEQLSAGANHFCGLDSDGYATCWGDLYRSFEDVPTDRRFQTLTAGEGGVCGIEPDGTTQCWGPAVTVEGMPAPPEERFIQVALSIAHACGVTLDHRVRCWGPDYLEEEGFLDVPEALR